jgi:hypothetical protein
MPSQPQDEWIYLRPEEFADDDAVERVEEVFDLGAEDAAVHIIDLDEPQVSNRPLDPGETLTNGRTLENPAAQYFDDEEPDRAYDERSTGNPDLDRNDPDEEPGLDDILASQHYAFEPELP